MEDLSTLIWIGIAVIWLLTRLVGRGAKKASRGRKKPQRPPAQAPTASPAGSPRRPFGSQSDFTGRGGQEPPPIVPR